VQGTLPAQLARGHVGTANVSMHQDDMQTPQGARCPVSAVDQDPESHGRRPDEEVLESRRQLPQLARADSAGSSSMMT
jgi:hypothetical protein